VKGFNLGEVNDALFGLSTLVGDRSRAIAATLTQSIGRGQDIRMACLSVLGTVDNSKHVGPSRGIAGVILLEWRKTEAEDTGKQYLSYFRHIDLSMDCASAMAAYMFHRFVVHQEPFLDLLARREKWYQIRLIANSKKNSDPTVELSCGAMAD